MATISRVELDLVTLAPTVARSDAIQSFEAQETPLLRITDSDGAVGTGYTYTIGTGGSSVVALLRDHLLPRLLGRDADRIEGIWCELAGSIHALTVGPIASLALAAIDTALWDLRCRRTGLPLHVAAGGAQTRVPLYSTEGGWLHLPTEALVEDALEVRERGWAGVKVKVGRPTIAEDVERLEAVRAAVGAGADLMVDANQAFRLDEALRRAWAYREVDLAWFEEPIEADDVTGHARLAASTSIPIAVGESLYSVRQFREYLHAGACSIVQVDAARIGGITPWLKVAHLAEAHGVAVAPHFLMELHVSLACATAAGARVEYIPQLDPIVTSRLTVKDGYAHPPEQPGLGIDWDLDAVARLGERVVDLRVGSTVDDEEATAQ
ncbi:MAG: mandelate racemase/muconate lactonizing enzyme family protein [Mycobacteriaceae bacterium]